MNAAELVPGLALYPELASLLELLRVALLARGARRTGSCLFVAFLGATWISLALLALGRRRPSCIVDLQPETIALSSSSTSQPTEANARRRHCVLLLRVLVAHP